LQRLPGFDDDFHFSLLPFWGNHCLIDFMLAGFAQHEAMDITIVLDEHSRSAQLALSSRWKKQVARVHVLEGGLSELSRMVASSRADRVVIASLSSVFLVEPHVLMEKISIPGDQLVKLSVARTPIEMYCTSGAHMAALLEAAALHDTGKMRLRESLFEGLLHSSMDVIEDLPGELLFQNDLMEYYANNIWVIANCQSARFHSAVSRLPELADRGAESHIAERGITRNSWIASGVEIEGIVEDSIIFPNVVIRRNALVSRSVVLTGNRIGSGTEIHRSLVLPFIAEVPRPSPNIGDNCAIGAKTSTMKNVDFPAQIRDGLTVIGANTDIPNGFRAEAASYVAPGVSPSYLKKLKMLKKGTSALADRPGASGESS
jgi:acetyltransferase-like isoleucine patch superfamily enzyme